MPILAVPFALSLAKETNIDRGRVQTKQMQVHGLARMEGGRLTLEWSGTVEIAEIQGGSVRSLRQSVPAQRLVLPAQRVALIELRGRWWRPYIELRTTGIGPLELVPTAVAGRVLLRITRRDWGAARELVSHMQLEMADAALKAAEDQGQLGRGQQQAEGRG
jgi:hypothetical protein